MNSMELHMGVKLPEDAREAIAKWTEKSYKMGLGQDWADDKWKVEDKNALDFFAKHDQHFFGQQFEHYRDDMRQVVEDELKGISAYTPAVKKRMRENLGEAFENEKVHDYYDLCIRNAVNKSRNYGRIFQYERLGIAEIEIVAILDLKTSKICIEMNGRRAEVNMLADYVRETLETPMNELTEKFAWPTDKDATEYANMPTSEIMDKIKCKLPPYHGRCRTTTVISKKINIRKSSGGNFSGDLLFNKKNEAANSRGKNLEKLRKDELLSKVSSRASTAWWDDRNKREWPDGTTRTSYEYHKAKHENTFKQAGGYDQALKNILKSYSNVYTFGDKKPEWIIYNKDAGTYLHLEDDGNILTFHKYRRFTKKDSMVEIK